MLRSSVIIATYNREEEVTNALRSVLIQTRLPNEVILVDDGNIGEFPLQQLFQDAGIRTLYHKKPTPGLAASRNIGVQLSVEDVILFLDDDVVLFPTYVEEIVRVFESDELGDIGGVGGSEANLIEPRSWRYWLRRFRDIIFLMGGFREGHVLPSGYCTEYGSTGKPIKKITEVDFLVGATSSYRRAVCEEYPFPSDIPFFGEDKYYSYGVSLRYRLLNNPHALLHHLESPKSRASRCKRGKQGILGRYYFFRKYLLRSRIQWILFYYALSGHIASRALVALVSRDPGDKEQLQGMLGAAREIVAAVVQFPEDGIN